MKILYSAMPLDKGKSGISNYIFNTLEEMLKHLAKIDVPVRERLVPAIGLHQVFLDDPNGIVIELNYPAHERTDLDVKNQQVAKV